jgi:hypothetical protein
LGVVEPTFRPNGGGRATLKALEGGSPWGWLPSYIFFFQFFFLNIFNFYLIFKFYYFLIENMTRDKGIIRIF